MTHTYIFVLHGPVCVHMDTIWVPHWKKKYFGSQSTNKRTFSVLKYTVDKCVDQALSLYNIYDLYLFVPTGDILNYINMIQCGQATQFSVT